MRLGTYAADKGDKIPSWVILSEDNKCRFIFQVISYAPEGTFQVDGDELHLCFPEDNGCVFKIKGDKLIFQSGESAEKFIEKGREFILEE